MASPSLLNPATGQRNPSASEWFTASVPKTWSVRYIREGLGIGEQEYNALCRSITNLLGQGELLGKRLSKVENTDAVEDIFHTLESIFPALWPDIPTL